MSFRNLLVGVFIVLAPTLELAPGFAQEAVPQTPVLLQMIRDDAIHNELKLTTDQITRVRAAHEAVDSDWFRARNLAAPKQAEQLKTLTESVRSALRPVLTADQMKRLMQLERQALGTRMLLMPVVVRSLGLNEDKQQKFVDQFASTDSQSKQIQADLQAGKLTNEEAQAKNAKLQAAERAFFAKELSQDQQVKIGSLTGTPFNFSKVKRTYPLAPELRIDGATWLQGGPLKLEELQGKVVAVHFYAFQCINCKRNLPHYNGWYKDYADKGLVVIGIQTPETSAERDPKRVSAAVGTDGLKYPVLMDGKSSNWKEWNNTMWPTVYLIDKKGFIRRWWQGEMNWKGTPGEQQMRSTIEQLLSES